MRKHKVLTGNDLIRYTGVYEDGWTYGIATFELKRPTKPADLMIEGTLPLLKDKEFKTELTVRLNGKEAIKKQLTPGDFQVRLTCLPISLAPKVELRFSQTQLLSTQDARQVGVLLHNLSFQTPATDIFMINGGISLWENWHPAETWAGETFRWVTNDAVLNVKDSNLNLEIEPGPGLGLQPFELLIRDEADQLLTSIKVHGRELVAVNIPKNMTKIKLHIEGGGQPSPNETRELNYRIFQVSSS